METNFETNLEAESLRPYQTAAEGSLAIWPVIGILAALFFGSFHYDSGIVRAIAITAYVVGVFAVVGWQAKRSGVQPRMGTMPKALRTNMFAFWAATTVVAALALVIGFTTSFLVAGVMIGVALTASGLVYHLRARAIMDRLVAAA